MTNDRLAYWLHAFFHEWLAGQRNCSRHMVLSYRDTWRIFLRFVAERRHRSVSALALADLTADDVLAFVKYVETQRRTSIGTRNCRLAAIRSFFRYVADHEPLAALQSAAVLRIPTKKGPRTEPEHLDCEEVVAILRQPDRSTLEGQRDHALLALLYNTGARIQEALNPCPNNIRLASLAQVKLFGKGRKERICPLWPETTTLLAALLKRKPRPDDEPLFVNRYGQPLGLGAAYVRFKLAQYVQAAGKGVPSLRKKRVHPHTFRHTAGVQLVAADVDVTVIRSLLEHVRLGTTNHHARANIEPSGAPLSKWIDQPVQVVRQGGGITPTCSPGSTPCDLTVTRSAGLHSMLDKSHRHVRVLRTTLSFSFKSALQLVDVRGLDHLVVGQGTVTSFVQRGLL